MTITTRRFHPNDIYAINQLVAKLATTQGVTANPSAEELMRDLEDQTTALEAAVAVSAKGEVVGFTMFHPSFYSSNTNTWQVFVLDLYVDDMYRNNGIGKSLLTEVAKYCSDRSWARGRGYEFFYLEVLETNIKALRFYERNGGTRNADAMRGDTEYYQMKFKVANLL